MSFVVLPDTENLVCCLGADDFTGSLIWVDVMSALHQTVLKLRKFSGKYYADVDIGAGAGAGMMEKILPLMMKLALEPILRCGSC